MSDKQVIESPERSTEPEVSTHPQPDVLSSTSDQNKSDPDYEADSGEKPSSSSDTSAEEIDDRAPDELQGAIDIDKFNDEKCEVTLIHEDNVKKAINELPDDELIVDLSDMFKIFGDQTRVKILMALESGELCVCDIAAVMNMSQSAISHQLRVLKQSNIVKTRRQGKVVYYSISDDHVKEIFDIAIVHVQE